MGNINDVLKGRKGETSYYSSCPQLLLLPILSCHSLPAASLHPDKKYFVLQQPNVQYFYQFLASNF